MKVEVDAQGKYTGPVDIYQLTAPNGRIYIGQCQCYRRAGAKRGWQAKGFAGRWREHKLRARSIENGGMCTALYASLRKYGPESFKTEILVRVPKAQANHYEAKFVKLLDTAVPNGLNLTSGGDAVEFTELARQRMSIASTGKVHSDKTKALVSSIVRTRNSARGLPLYVTISKANPIAGFGEGYRTSVRHKGSCRSKAFVSRNLSMKEKLRLVVEARDQILKDLGLPAVVDDPVVSDSS